MGLGKFHNWKPFLKSESHSKDSWLSWEERRKGEGAVEQVAMSASVSRGHLEQSKCADTLETALPTRPNTTLHRPPSTSDIAVTMSVSWILLYSCPHSQTFCPMLKSDMLNSILIIIICFQRKWKTNSLNVLEWIIPYCQVWDFKWMSSIRL